MIFAQYPKTRKALPREYQVLYEDYYLVNRQGKSNATSLAGRMESWMHKITSGCFDKSKTTTATLEIGAGTLNHLNYEQPGGKYDIAEPFKTLYHNSPNLGKVNTIYSYIREIPEDVKYDRILSIAVLEHLENLPAEIALAALHLTGDGRFLAAIPGEGTLLWKLGWKLTTGLEFRMKYKLKYHVLMEYEHVNTAQEIEGVLKYFFSNVQYRVFGLSKKLSFYRFYHCEKPDTEKCLNFLEKYYENPR